MKKINGNLVYLVIITFLLKIMGFILRIIEVRVLDDLTIKTLHLCHPILNLAIILSTCSMPQILTKKIAYNLGKKTYSNRGLILYAIKRSLILSTITILFFLIASYPISHFLYKNDHLILPIIIMMPLLYFSNISQILKSYLDSHSLFKISSMSNLIEGSYKFILSIIVILLFKNSGMNLVIYLTLILSSSEITSFTYLIFKIKKMTPLKFVKVKKDPLFIKESIYLTIFGLISSLSNFLEPIYYYNFIHKNIDYYILLNSYAIPFLETSSFLCYIVIKVAFPKFSLHKDSKAKLDDLFF